MAKIFVYGTLLKGCRNYDHYLKDHVSVIQPAFVKGVLYSIKHCDYPALIDGGRMIYGEIMEINEQLIPILDQLEGYHHEDDSMNEYDKKIVPIYDKQGNQIDLLPVYFYNFNHPMQINSLDQIIESNHYRQWLQKDESKKHHH